MLNPVVCALGTAPVPAALPAEAPHLAGNDLDHPIFQ
jgi:hypothetical protein